jgi:hypothetical protein
LDAADFTIEGDEERLKVVEREWKLGRWQDGPLLRAANRLDGSLQYMRLIDTWKHREGMRTFRVSEICHHSELNGVGLSSMDEKKGAQKTRPLYAHLFGLFYRWSRGSDD